jgi:probable HAF family extracellular repeat protein
VVGWANTASGAKHAFLFAGGHMTDIGRLVPGAVSSEASDITNDGAVVGTAVRGDGSPVGFLYRDGAVTVLPSRTMTCCQVVGGGLNEDLQIIAHGLIGGFIVPVPEPVAPADDNSARIGRVHPAPDRLPAVLAGRRHAHDPDRGRGNGGAAAGRPRRVRRLAALTGRGSRWREAWGGTG